MAKSEKHHEPAVCDAALSRVFEFLGKRWNGVIIGTLTSGPATFSALARTVTGISDSVLSERLTGLNRVGLVVRTVESGPPISVVYELSPAGLALAPALDELRRWGEQNMPSALDPSFVP